MARKTERSRWRMTTRSRFAAVLGVAGLGVAGVQLAMIDDPPTVVQLVVLSFWSVVGVAYLVSAAGAVLRARRTPAAGSTAVDASIEEPVPVPARPDTTSQPTERAGPKTERAAEQVEAAPASGEVAATSLVSIPARRSAPRVAVPPVAPMSPGVRPAPTPPAANPAPRPAAFTPAPEETTDAFTVRATATASRPGEGPPSTSGLPVRDGLGSALSFGPAPAPPWRPPRRARPSSVMTPPAPISLPDVSVPDVSAPGDTDDDAAAPTSIASLDDLRRTRAEAIAAAAASGIDGPASASRARPVARGRRAGTGDVPGTRRARHRSAAEDPVAARRGRAVPSAVPSVVSSADLPVGPSAEPSVGRHARSGVHSVPRRAATGR